MKRILIAASQPHISHVVSQTLSTVYSISMLDIGAKPISGRDLSQIRKRDVDIIVYVGDLARSSWDPENSFPTENATLESIAQIAEERQIRVVMISSDRVFNGPTLFHDDLCESFCPSKQARQAFRYENMIRTLPDSLVIRTNIVDGSRDEDAFCNRVMSALELNQSLSVDSSVFSTPIALDSFCQNLLRVLQHNCDGVINIAGAERSTPFHFALQLARQCGFDPQLIEPKQEVAGERSLRCSALRTLGATAPLLRETIEMLSVGQESAELLAA